MKVASTTTLGSYFLFGLCAALLIDSTRGRTAFSVKSQGLWYTSNPRNAFRSLDHEVPLVDRILDVRGGASRPKKKSRARSATLSSSKTAASSLTATGKKKVGSSKADAEKKSTVSDLMKKYNQILPVTRIYITAIAISTVLGFMLGEELTQGLFALDPMRVFRGMELWRPFTAAVFLGKPSIGTLMSGYYLFEYGSSLERAYGTAQHIIFLLQQIVLLTILSTICGLPFFTNSVITSMLHVLSRATPHQKVKWLVFNVEYWMLPYGLMLGDCLQAGNASAAMPHILGILSGHFYYYHRFIWPKTGGEDWLSPPDFILRRFDPDAKRESSKESINKALKSRRRSKGSKLGGK
jgi:Derlin-1